MGTCWLCALRDRVKYALGLEQNIMYTLLVALAAFPLSWASNKQAGHLLGKVSLAVKNSPNQLLAPLPTEKIKEKHKRRVHHTKGPRAFSLLPPWGAGSPPSPLEMARFSLFLCLVGHNR